ncbi:MAG: hypothetical protein NXH95_21540 [Pseudomonadaceae bacterium]|nr:hypothetical protein [Pseudomonadaceae bacterium]
MTNESRVKLSAERTFKSPILLVLVLLLWSGAVKADNYGNLVEVCNHGDVDLRFLSYATSSSFFGGDRGEISGFYTIRPGDCGNVNPSGYQTVAVGFLQTNNKGVNGNPVYKLNDVPDDGSLSWLPSIVCAPPNDAVMYTNSIDLVRSNYLPPCKPGLVEVRMSFGVMPNDRFPKFNLTPRSSDALSSWLKKPPNSTDDRQGEAKSRANESLEDGYRRNIANACVEGKLYQRFLHPSDNPKGMCECFARNIVRGEGPLTVHSISVRAERGEDLLAALDRHAPKTLYLYSSTCGVN